MKSVKTLKRKECGVLRVEGRKLPSSPAGSSTLIPQPSSLGPRSGFTMIEIAISLAVIGFALVAIIGILPQGMTVQKENRQETIINQDANMYMEAIRNGGKGFDDLTNYVVAITNYWKIYNDKGPLVSHVEAHTYTGAWLDGTPTGNWITNGLRIIGLLTTPRYVDNSQPSTIFFRSNYIVAYVRSMSGQAGEKFPQTNSSMLELAFGYRLMPEIVPYTYYEPDWTNYTIYKGSTNNGIGDWVWRSNYWRVASTVQTNLCDLRLTFRWPSFPNGKVGNDRQIFRTVAGGRLLQTNNLGMPLWFFEPRTYVKAKLP
jgi:prepilin-type N-terminal cleavage/methylation domain-containing protein